MREELPAPMIVVIGASAGGIHALITVLGGLPRDFPAPVVIVQHRSPTTESLLVSILARRSLLPVSEAREGGSLEPGTIYVARPDLHLSVTDDGHFAYAEYSTHHLLSSVNPLFISSAARFGTGVIAVVLSGSGTDGTAGVKVIKELGGTVIAQDAATAGHFGMPGSAIETGAVDFILPVDEIAAALIRLAAAA